MRRSSYNSFYRFVPVLVIIVVTIAIVAIVIAVGRALIGGGGESQGNGAATQVDEGRTALLSTDLSRSVRLTVRGPIVADEKHRSYQVTIGPESRVMTTYEGYVETALESTRLKNNLPAYEELVHALDKRKMMNGRTVTVDQNDLRGICATGRVYQFETMMNSSAVRSLWTSDCSGSRGSAQADVGEIVSMFMQQIPDGEKMARSVGLQQRGSLLKL